MNTLGDKQKRDDTAWGAGGQASTAARRGFENCAQNPAQRFWRGAQCGKVGQGQSRQAGFVSGC